MKWMKNGLTVLKFIVMAVGVVFIVHSGYKLLTRDASDEKSVPMYQTGNVTRGNMETTVSSTGTLAAVGTVDVGTQVSGTISKVFVDYNTHVKKGQVLAVLDLALFETAVNEARASVAQADAKLKQADAEYIRNKPLFDSGNLSAQEFLSLETDKAQAKANLLSAQATLKRAMTNLNYAQIRSPIDGTVISRNIEAGQTVAASLSTPTLFIIAEDLARMQIEANVDESDIGQIRLNQNARFTVQAYPDEHFTGKVTQIRMNPTTVSNVVTYTVIVDAPNKEGHLLPGMTATIDFIVAKADNVLLVPNGAFRFRPKGIEKDGAGSTIYLLGRNGQPEKVAVETGITDGNVTAVTDGPDLKEGSVVITGFQTEKVKTTRSLLSRLFPRPPGGGHGR
jgi:HlyD family secretion protein